MLSVNSHVLLSQGLPKVENPTVVKVCWTFSVFSIFSRCYGDRDPSSFGLFQAVLYEKAGLEGRCVEVHGDVFSFGRTETDPDDHGLNCVESLKILGGL